MSRLCRVHILPARIRPAVFARPSESMVGMLFPPHFRRVIAVAWGLAGVWLATGGVSEADAGFLHPSWIDSPATTFDGPRSCCPCEESSVDAANSADPGHGTAADDPGESRGGGGGGADGTMSITGKSVSFGNEGGFSKSSFRSTSRNGFGGIGPGGGGGGGGSSSFFPAGNSTGSGTTGNVGDGSDGSSTTNIPIPGSGPADPITPDPGTTYVFHYNIIPGGPGDANPLFFDPPVYSGYTFQILSGPNFASVEVPVPSPGAGATQFSLHFESYTETLTAGIPFYFTSIDPAGVSQFTITGEFGGDAALQSQTFDTAIAFVGGGNGSFSQTPILSTPEPASLLVWGLGAVALFGMLRQRS